MSEIGIKPSYTYRAIFKSQTVYEVLSFLDQPTQITLQQLNRTFYMQMIPKAVNQIIKGNCYLPIYFEDMGKVYQVKFFEEKGEKKKQSRFDYVGRIRNMPDIQMETIIVTPYHKIYMIGGYKMIQDQIVAQNLNFNVIIEKEEVNLEKKLYALERANMKTQRYCFGYCVLDMGRFILIVGGAKNINDHCEDVELYDTLKDKWINLPSLNERKYTPSIVQVKDKIYCFGGTKYNNQTKRNTSDSSIEILFIDDWIKNAQRISNQKEYDIIVNQQKWVKVQADTGYYYNQLVFSQTFALYNEFTDKIYLMGNQNDQYDYNGKKVKMFHIPSNKMKVMEDSHHKCEDRFFYNNYSVLNEGKQYIVLGRKFIHQIDIEGDKLKLETIGEGYEQLMKKT